jgi:hypothetical protein
MITTVMIEWLNAFYAFIGNGRALLLMDNFPAHLSGVELAPPPPNVRIQWLPANSTSITQPLDQGIINSLKAQYKRYWLSYIIEQYEQNLNPLESMNIYHAFRWIARAWPAVTDTTIYRCFRKAKIIDQVPIQLPAEPALNLESLYQEVRDRGQIQDIMSIHNFLNPAGEDTPPAGLTQTDPIDGVYSYTFLILIRFVDAASVHPKVA